MGSCTCAMNTKICFHEAFSKAPKANDMLGISGICALVHCKKQIETLNNETSDMQTTKRSKSDLAKIEFMLQFTLGINKSIRSQYSGS